MTASANHDEGDPEQQEPDQPKNTGLSHLPEIEACHPDQREDGHGHIHQVGHGPAGRGDRGDFVLSGRIKLDKVVPSVISYVICAAWSAWDSLPTEVAAQRSENDRASILTRSVRLREGVSGLRWRQKERLHSARSRRKTVNQRRRLAATIQA